MEGAAGNLLKQRKPRQVILTSHDERLVGRFRNVVVGCGIELTSLTDVGLPEPAGSTRDPVQSATIKASVVAALTDTPTIGYAPGFYIDPMLRWGGGGPQWFWPVPWPFAGEELAARLAQADKMLDGCGYCGPDDRGAYFRTVLCLAWPDYQSQIFEGQVDGQFQIGRGWNRGGFSKLGELVDNPMRCFVPEGETVTLASLSDEARRRHSDQEQAFQAFREAISG